MTPPCTCRARAAANSAPRAVIRCPRCVVQDTYFEQLRAAFGGLLDLSYPASGDIEPILAKLIIARSEGRELLSDIDAALAGIEAGKP